MKTLAILAGIAAFILLLLLLPLHVRFSYKESPAVFLRILFIKLRVFPQDEKKAQKKEEKKARKEQKHGRGKEKGQAQEKSRNPLALLYQQEGLSGFLHILSSFAKTSKEIAGRLAKRVQITVYEVSVLIAGGDSAAIAVNYGRVSAAVFSASAILLKHAEKAHAHVEVTPDFLGEKSRIACEIAIKVKIIWLVAAAAKAFCRLLKFQFRRARGGAKQPDVKTREEAA